MYRIQLLNEMKEIISGPPENQWTGTDLQHHISCYIGDRTRGRLGNQTCW